MAKDTNQWVTAEELMTELMKDPAYVKKMKEKEARRNKRAEIAKALEQPILAKLSSCGFECNSINELVNEYSPLPATAVAILLSEVPLATDDGIRLELIRALGASAIRFDGRPLADCYDSQRDLNTRWVILNTIALAHPHSIEGWLEAARKDPWVERTLRELGR
jgi:hypothetical protein